MAHHKLLIATQNQAKCAEIKRLLGDIPYEVVSLADLGITHDVEETGTTFEENALLKAKEYSALTGLPALADDSGLEIDALHGEPGIYTNRYAGEHATEEEKRLFILNKMKNVPSDKRQAKFTVVMALAWAPEDIEITRTEYHGMISKDIRGTPIPKFPYRSIFIPEGSEFTLAELIERGEKIKSPRDDAVANIRKILLENSPMSP
jgi:XTP/dITP diphosphohydrolase